MKGRSWLGALLDSLLLFLMVAVLIWPLFRAEHLDYWSSIESTFIADARFLKNHWPHPNWQPNWYCGTRTDYIYPPALRYGTAFLSKLLNSSTVRGYHLYISVLYCFGISAVYLLARFGSNSRPAGWIAALLTAVVSPSFLFVERIREDTPLQIPYRLWVLLFYGEGPHMSAVAWLPLALICSFAALKSFRAPALVLAAFCSAGVVSNNFYGATALAVLFPILVISIYITHLDAWVFARAAAIAALAYGWTAFWMVPSYLQVTLNNMQFVSSEGNMWSAWAGAGTILGFVLIADSKARGRKELAYFVFLCGALAAFVVQVLGHEFLNFRIIGEPSRLYPELDMIMILFTVEVLRRMWNARSRFAWAGRAAALAGVAAVLLSSHSYLANARTIYKIDSNPFDNVEFQMQDWMAKNMPGTRAMAAGSVRFWYNAWNDLAQVGGGSEQGLTNPLVVNGQWEILLGRDFGVTLEWLRLLGVDAVLVNEKHSKELFHDYHTPEKFAGKLPVLYDDHAGNLIYEVPRRYRSLARVVDRRAFDALPSIPGNGDQASLGAWSAVLEQGPDAPTTTEWKGTDELVVRAPVKAGQSVFVQVSYDTNWRAYSGASRLPVRNTKTGLMLIDAPAGTQELRLLFPTPRSNQVGRVVTGLTILLSAALLFQFRRPSKVPA